MKRRTSRAWTIASAARALVASAALASAGVASADTIFQTSDPEGGFFGYIGFDIFETQSVAARFIPTGECTLDTVSIWLMSNDFDGVVPQTVTITLRTDTNPGGDFVSVPSTTILETWTASPNVIGWTPILVDFNSATHPTLAAGQKYWVVAESEVEAQVNPIWVWSSSGNEFTATNSGGATPWQSGSGAAIGIQVKGTLTSPPCAADFDGSGSSSIDDLFIYLNAWFSSCDGTQPGAPCNGRNADMNAAGGVTIDDLFIFLNAWFAGC